MSHHDWRCLHTVTCHQIAAASRLGASHNCLQTCDHGPAGLTGQQERLQAHPFVCLLLTASIGRQQWHTKRMRRSDAGVASAVGSLTPMLSCGGTLKEKVLFLRTFRCHPVHTFHTHNINFKPARRARML